MKDGKSLGQVVEESRRIDEMYRRGEVDYEEMTRLRRRLIYGPPFEERFREVTGLRLRDVALSLLALSGLTLLQVLLILSGEPQSVWLWCSVLGLC